LVIQKEGLAAVAAGVTFLAQTLKQVLAAQAV
jgi:hypothetical protein